MKIRINNVTNPKRSSYNFFSVSASFLPTLFFTFFCFANPVKSIGQENVLPVDSLKEVIQAIPLIEIPQEAVLLTQKIQNDLTPELQKQAVFESRPLIDSVQIHLEELSVLTDQLLEDQLPYSFYESLLLRWAQLETEIKKPEDLLNNYSTDLSKIEVVLDKDKERWQKTQSETINKDSPEELVKRVDEIIGLIESTGQLVTDRIGLALNLLNNTAELKLTIGDYKMRVDDTQESQFHELLKIRSKPIWVADLSRDSTAAFGINRSLIDFGLEDASGYLKANKNEFSSLGIIFVLILALIYWLRKQRDTLSDEIKSSHSAGLFIVARPIISALMLTLLWGIGFLPEMPFLLDRLMSFLFLIPFLVIFHGIVGKPLRGSLYYLFVLFIYINFSPFFYIGAGTNRLALIFESLLIAAFLYWFLRNRHKIKTDNLASDVWYRFLLFISPLYLVGILGGVGANLIGYININRLLAYGILVSLLLALIFGTAYFAVRGLLLLFTATRLAGMSKLIHAHKQDFFKIFDRLAWITTVLAWLYLTIKNFRLWEALSSWAIDIWNIGYVFGNIEVTIGGIVSFFIIIILSWLVSRLVRLLLQEEILGRFKMPRGVPMAISSVTQYVLVFIGIILALAYAGFDLQNLGLMAGALGVGIGFGLQNVVGNFISGLILVFERPVTVGDIVKVDNHDGTVVSIGIRSSIIRQWDGSRIIVPNSDLITKKVLNWSMAKYERRFIVTIYTPPETDPDLVMKIMGEAAKGVEGVMEDPEAMTYFKGIVDQALKFEQFYWVSDNILNVQSDVNLAIQRALRAAGIKILLPRKVEIQEQAKPATRQRKTTAIQPENTSDK